jgi:hypothetical protein
MQGKQVKIVSSTQERAILGYLVTLRDTDGETCCNARHRARVPPCRAGSRDHMGQSLACEVLP